MSESPKGNITGLKPLPGGSFEVIRDTPVDSSPRGEFDPQEMRKDLEDLDLQMALNPPPTDFDVLHAQVERPVPEPPSGISDFSQIKDLKRPTDIDLPPSKIIQPGSPVPNPSAKIELATEYTPREERSTIPQVLNTYVEDLIKGGLSRLRLLKFDIEDVKTRENAREIINKYKTTGRITEDQRKKMLDLLEGSSEDMQEENNTEGNSIKEVEADNFIAGLRNQIKTAESEKDETKVLRLEDDLHKAEQEVLSVEAREAEKEQYDLNKKKRADIKRSITIFKKNIKKAEIDKDEHKVLKLEDAVHKAEHYLISIDKELADVDAKNEKIRRTIELNEQIGKLDEQIKIQTEKVRVVENSDEKAYREELAKLRAIEDEKKALTKTEEPVASPAIETGSVDPIKDWEWSEMGIAYLKQTAIENGVDMSLVDASVWQEAYDQIMSINSHTGRVSARDKFMEDLPRVITNNPSPQNSELPISIPLDTWPPVLPPEPPLDIPPPIDILPPVKSPEQINAELESARSDYAAKLIEWKNKNRENKYKFKTLISNLYKSAKNVTSDLGLERQMPEGKRPQKLMDAEGAYMEAKKEKNRQKFSESTDREVKNKKGEVVGKYEFNAGLFDQARIEFDELQKRIAESLPPLEKGIVAKSLEKWAKVPLLARIALTTTLMTGAGMLFGTVAVAGAGTALAYRGARSLSGAIVGQVIGEAAGEILEDNSKRRIEKARENYASGIDEHNFEKKEKELMRFYDKEENRVKRNRLKKAGVMMAAGVEGNLAFSTLTDLAGVSVGTSIDNIRGDRPVVNSDAKAFGLSRSLEDFGKRGPDFSKDINLPQPPEAVSPVPEVQVELSQKGFIQDIHNMKAKILAQYDGDVDKIPEKIKTNVFGKSSMDLAKQYGFYDPKTGMSGMGHAGEHLSVDADGHLVYEHGGKADTMFDSETGKVKTFENVGGTMFIPKVSPEVVSVPEDLPAVDVSAPPEVAGSQPSLSVESGEYATTPGSFKSSSIDLPQVESTTHYPFQNGIVDVLDKQGESVVMFRSTEIGHESILNVDGKPHKIYSLPDNLQEGSNNAPYREAFTSFFQKNIDLSRFANKMISQDFEGGKVHILRGLDKSDPMGVRVLLNGKEIGKSIMTSGGVKVEIDPALKGGWLFSDTVYERALKSLKPIIKTLQFK